MNANIVYGDNLIASNWAGKSWAPGPQSGLPELPVGVVAGKGVLTFTALGK